MGIAIKKILFIKASGELNEFDTVSPPLGLLILAAIAREKLNLEVKFVDGYINAKAKENVRQIMLEWQPELVGISALTAESPAMHTYANLVKTLSPTSKVICGGPHPTAYPDETLANESIDLAVINEGEETFIDIVESLRKGKAITEIAGIAYRNENGQLTFSQQRTFIEELDQIPMPAFDLVNFEAYANRTSMTPIYRRRYMPMMTSRGCPFRCTYCHTIQGKRFRSHSPDYVINMIKTLKNDYHVHNFEFFDDIFNWNSERMMKILHRIVDEKLDIKFSFPNGLRGDRLTSEEIAMLAKAGCDFACIAIESATPRLQKFMKKHLDLGRARHAINEFVKNGVFTCGFFMLGFPTEEKDELKATINFATNSPLHMAYFLTVTPFQGTEIHEAAIDYHLLENEKKVYKDIYANQKINLSQVDDNEFFRLKKHAYIRFYLNPIRMLRIFWAIPDKLSLLRRFFGLLRLAFLDRPGNQFQPLKILKKKLQQIREKKTLPEYNVNKQYKADYLNSKTQ